MNILWIVIMVLPDLAKALGIQTGSSGTWMFELSKSISQSENINLAIACVYGKEFKKIQLEEITYYLIPGGSKSFMFYNKSLIRYWNQVEDDFKPEIVHIHGTEYTHSISYLRNYPDKKYVLSIQGVVSKISKSHTADLTIRELLHYRTLKENLHLNGMIERKILSLKNSRYEREIISKMSYATGRTDWDKAFMLSINPNLKYYRCYYNLRDEFYNAKKWELVTCEKHTIYASTSAQTPLKGGHIVLKALDLVRRRYPDVKAYFLAPKAIEGKLVITSGYTKYISKLIRELDLEDNVEFLNRLDTNGVIGIMQKSNVCVIPSACENASATLREAIHIGTPSIAAFRGGMTDLLEDGKSGFFYDFPDYELLAYRICEIFENPVLANSISNNAISFAEKIHDRKKNTKDFISMYDDIIN
ncbi:MAG: glycosyltransferase [Lachnospiraceae bacterium]|nr:glycosyltransferase [Lachnospiraceae bacterium]